MISIGIDPGISGAIAMLKKTAQGSTLMGLWDMPIADKLYGKGQQVNALELAGIIDSILSRTQAKNIRANVEQVSAAKPQGRKQGAASMLTYGYGAGIIHGILAAKRIRIDFVNPRAWKMPAGLRGRPKGASRTLASQLFPEWSEDFKLVKHHGRADAVLIGLHQA